MPMFCICIAKSHPHQNLNTILPRALTTTAMALNAAPIANCDSAEAGIKDLNAQVKLQGFAIITKRSKKDKQTPATVRKLWLICDQGRPFTDVKQRQ